jgi:hypothetical protein
MYKGKSNETSLANEQRPLKIITTGTEADISLTHYLMDLFHKSLCCWNHCPPQPSSDPKLWPLSTFFEKVEHGQICEMFTMNKSHIKC